MNLILLRIIKNFLGTFRVCMDKTNFGGLMNLLKKFCMLLNLVTYSFLGCMDQEALIPLELDEYNESEEKKDVLERIKQVINNRKLELEAAEEDGIESRQLITELSTGILEIDRLINNPDEANELTLEGLREIHKALIGGDEAALEHALKIINDDVSDLRKRKDLNCKNLRGFLIFLGFCIALISYFIYCSRHHGEGICFMHDYNDTAPRRY